MIVDTDPCLLTLGLDLDDDLALLLLLGSPELEIVGVTTTYGNSFGFLTFEDACALLRQAGRSDIPVRRGAGFFARDLRPTAASRFLVEAITSAPGEITLLTLGPLTNLAAALHDRPDLGGLLREIVIMGGRSKSGVSEFNFRADPEATNVVLGVQAHKTQITFDLCFGVAVTPADVDRFAGPGTTLARQAPRIRRFARFQDRFRAWRGRGPGEATGGFHPWDAIAASWLVDPSLFGEIGPLIASVDTAGRSRVGSFEGEGAAMNVPGTLDASRFRELFFERVRAGKSLSEKEGPQSDPLSRTA